MFQSNRILYVRYLPESLIYLFVIICLTVYSRYNCKHLIRVSQFELACIYSLSCIWFYDQIWIGNLTFLSIICTLIKISCAIVLVTISLKNKIWILKSFIKTIQVIVGLSLIGWILFLLNIQLPHFTDQSDAYYIHTVYFLFNLNGFPDTQLFPRFAGPFLEPGHLGTMCVFLLYIEKFQIRKIGNLILLLGVLFSLSLAAYGLLVGAVILSLYSRGKWIWSIGIVGFFMVCGICAMLYNDGDNAVNQAIVLRLEMDDNGEIAGNNRTSRAFDIAYDKFLKSDEIVFGVGNRAFGERDDGSDNITIGCATYKRYFFLRGIVGAFIIISFLFFYWYKYRNKSSFGYLIV